MGSGGAFTAAIAALVLVGCGGGGGDTDSIAGGGSDAGSRAGDAGGSRVGDAGGGGTLVVPAECASSAAGAVPSEVSFRFVNEGTAPLWIGSTCSRPIFSVSSCLDGYAKPIARSGCTECGAATCKECPSAPAVCVDNVKEVSSETPHTATWSTEYWVAGRIETGTGCDCSTKHAAPAAKYRLRVGVHTSAPDSAGNFEPDYFVDKELELPTTLPIDVRIDR